jgi:hypothetical protein
MSPFRPSQSCGAWEPRLARRCIIAGAMACCRRRDLAGDQPTGALPTFTRGSGLIRARTRWRRRAGQTRLAGVTAHSPGNREPLRGYLTHYLSVLATKDAVALSAAIDAQSTAARDSTRGPEFHVGPPSLAVTCCDARRPTQPHRIRCTCASQADLGAHTLRHSAVTAVSALKNIGALALPIIQDCELQSCTRRR